MNAPPARSPYDHAAIINKYGRKTISIIWTRSPFRSPFQGMLTARPVSDGLIEGSQRSRRR